MGATVRTKFTCPQCHTESEVDIPLPPQSKGGRVRMSKITPEQRKEYARKGVETRKRNKGCQQ